MTRCFPPAFSSAVGFTAIHARAGDHALTSTPTPALARALCLSPNSNHLWETATREWTPPKQPGNW